MGGKGAGDAGQILVRNLLVPGHGGFAEAEGKAVSRPLRHGPHGGLPAAHCPGAHGVRLRGLNQGIFLDRKRRAWTEIRFRQLPGRIRRRHAAALRRHGKSARPSGKAGAGALAEGAHRRLRGRRLGHRGPGICLRGGAHPGGGAGLAEMGAIAHAGLRPRTGGKSAGGAGTFAAAGRQRGRGKAHAGAAAPVERPGAAQIRRGRGIRRGNPQMGAALSEAGGH